jgi:hypothetical protein
VTPDLSQSSCPLGVEKKTPHGDEMNDREMMNARELARKVEWEGGVLGALEYGIRSEEVDDPELATLWHRMETIYEQLRPSIRLANQLLSDARRRPTMAARPPSSHAGPHTKYR